MDVKIPASGVFSEIQQCVGTANYKVKTIVPNQTVIAEGKRDFSWIVIIILGLVFWPTALVYYFIRQRSNITATITKDSEDECNVTITSNGKTGDDLIEFVKDVLQEEKSKSDDNPENS